MALRVIWQYMDRSIYCHMTLSAMNYLLYSIIRPIVMLCLTLPCYVIYIYANNLVTK